ncbi:hypothetical protein NA56DRAFT_696603 [Hyaloscypha hepaticicola]|uniref:Uncharacterized protein n=1 Tax=Hyaloscypha hepaticicola TaxID=2082293 RepID=A0A2J6QMY0_9HELO|nr:hypothetical protein NA56DRAFT_696603 [Hyaloscypha hepaticicola]
MQLFDFAVVFFSNECRGDGCGSGGCGVVEGDGRLGERETRTVKRQGISGRRNAAHGPAISLLDWTVDKAGKIPCRLRGRERERGLFRENSVQRFSNLALGGDSVSGQLFQGAKGGLWRCWIRVGREVAVAEISLFNRQGKAIRRWEEMALAQYLQYLVKTQHIALYPFVPVPIYRLLRSPLLHNRHRNLAWRTFHAKAKNAQITSTDHEVWIRGTPARGTKLIKSHHPEAENALRNKIPWQYQPRRRDPLQPQTIEVGKTHKRNFRQYEQLWARRRSFKSKASIETVMSTSSRTHCPASTTLHRAPARWSDEQQDLDRWVYADSAAVRFLPTVVLGPLSGLN